MARAIRKTLILYGIGALVLASVSFAQEGATAQVKGTIDKVLEILRDPALKAPDKAEARRKKLKEVIYPRFDFSEMAKRTLGMHWRNRTPKEREEFVSLFADLLEQSYYKKLESYTDEEILYTKEQLDEKFGVVATKIVSQKENIDIPIEYKLLRHDAKWLVYDVVIEGVSMVSNYRSQFNRIIETSSYAELVKRMRVKQEDEALGTTPTSKQKK
ncbi:MAG TPA: ABC transporter substrate-binding protein [Candidatus Methylomirabilis sp.]|nr:ABC transporter substrate-binding protein [Candidatus Methylomirabilis sp.]